MSIRIWGNVSETDKLLEHTIEDVVRQFASTNKKVFTLQELIKIIEDKNIRIEDLKHVDGILYSRKLQNVLRKFVEEGKLYYSPLTGYYLITRPIDDR
ncbi:MAG: hypothetical protein GXO23_01105 [Crenarchaeota archaeon]|nr:hypothetical protein [Thermoproteota archaeon]